MGKKRWLKIIICIIIAICAFIIIIPPQFKTISAEMEENWNVNLPKGKVIYQKDNFTIDGIKYAVVQCDDREKLNSVFPWSKLNNQDIKTVDNYLDELSVNKRIRPIYDDVKSYEVKEDDDTLYIIYSEQQERLYILEIFY